MLAAVYCLAFSACSINKMAMKSVSDALTQSGSSNVFTSDSDPVLVGKALPFAIKMYESLLGTNPEHLGLLRTTGSLFVMYANAYVQGPAEQLPRWMVEEKQLELDRAKKFYLRGLDMLYKGMELKYPGFRASFQNENLQDKITDKMPEILAKFTKDDVTSLYWAAVAGISAFSINIFDMGLSLRVQEFLWLIERAYELDPDYNSGALDDFLLLYYASVPQSMGGSKAKADEYFQKAVAKSGGLSVSPYVSYAKTISIPEQDYDTFKTYLESALAIDVDADPPNRLVNTINRQKAQFLLDSAEQYFLYIGSDDDWYDDWDDEWDNNDW